MKLVQDLASWFTFVKRIMNLLLSENEGLSRLVDRLMAYQEPLSAID
jgi:hypothetical protein